MLPICAQIAVIQIAGAVPAFALSYAQPSPHTLDGIHPTPRASLAMVPQFLESGIIDANGICVYTAIGIYNFVLLG
jgi:hypothetical protein